MTSLSKKTLLYISLAFTAVLIFFFSAKSVLKKQPLEEREGEVFVVGAACATDGECAASEFCSKTSPLLYGPMSAWTAPATSSDPSMMVFNNGRFSWRKNASGTWVQNGIDLPMSDFWFYSGSGDRGVKAADDGTLPYSNYGITTGWTNYNSSKPYLFITNGDWYWTYKYDTAEWLFEDKNGNNVRDAGEDLNGFPRRLSAAWTGTGIQPAGSIYPWSNGGPTAAWTNPANNRVTIANGKYIWNRWADTGEWDGPYDLSVKSTATSIWHYEGSNDPDGGCIETSDHTLPWSNQGLTSAWENLNLKNVYICNGDWCWGYKYEGADTGWLKDANGNKTGNPIKLSGSSEWKANLQPASDGSWPWTPVISPWTSGN